MNNSEKYKKMLERKREIEKTINYRSTFELQSEYLQLVQTMWGLSDSEAQISLKAAKRENNRKFNVKKESN
jgi:hypothetical protein